MILPVRATAHLQTSQRPLLLYEGNNNIVNNLYKTRWCTRECVPISSAPTPRRICWAGSELSVSLPRWSLTALWTGTALFTTRSYALNIKHLLHECTRWPFHCISDNFRRCSSYQDFTQIGGSTESVDFPRPPSDGEDPSQKHRHISRTLSEPSQLTGGRMGTSQSEHRGRRSMRQRNSRLSRQTLYLNPSGLLKAKNGLRKVPALVFCSVFLFKQNTQPSRLQQKKSL